MPSILGVELARVGTWDLAIGGRTRFTAEDFTDAIAASHDPDYGIMAIRPGHTDPRFDGEPALGRVENMRMAGDRLLGDLVDLPAWLTERIHAAYPERSIEGYRGVTSPTGRRYRLVLTSLALLGVSPPAMQGLADLPAAVAAAWAAGWAAAGGSSTRLAAASSEMGLWSDAPSESEPPETEPATVSADEPRPEGSLMDPTAIRSALGLAADATDNQVIEALAAQSTALTAAQTARTAAEARVAELEAAGAAPAGGPALPEGLEAVDSQALADLRVAAAQGVEALQIVRGQQRDQFIQRHIAAGRLTPANTALRESLAREWDRDPAAAEQVAASLAVVMPVGAARGVDGGTEKTADDLLYAELYGAETGA